MVCSIEARLGDTRRDGGSGNGGCLPAGPADEHPVVFGVNPDQLSAENLGLARSVAGRALARAPRHVERDDVFGAACLGLVEAARRYRPEQGVPFRAYAARRVLGAILDGARTDDWLTRRGRAALRDSSEEERWARPVALPEHWDRPDEGVTPDVIVETRAMAEQLRGAVLALEAKRRHVLVAEFWGRRSGVDIAEELGVSPARVSQLRKSALRELWSTLAGSDDAP